MHEAEFRIQDGQAAIECIKKEQGKRPFDCPHLLVTKKRIKHGSTTFEKGQMLCTSTFLDICCLFGRVKADEEGNIVARCGKNEEEIEVVLRKLHSTHSPPR